MTLEALEKKFKDSSFPSNSVLSEGDFWRSEDSDVVVVAALP